MLCLEHATNKEAAARLRECVFALLFRAPLFGLTVLGTAIRVYEKPATETCTTMCTDGRTIWYDPEWVLKKPRLSISFDVLHEVLHIFNNHPARCGQRDWNTWSEAVDIRVAHDGLTIFQAKGDYTLDKDHIQAYPWAAGLTAEQIYDELVKDATKKKEAFEPDIRKPPPTTKEADDHFKQKLTHDLLQGVMAEEQQRGKRPLALKYGAAVWERLQELRRCDVPWHVLLQGRLCAQLGNEHISWVPLNRRYLPLLALPSHRGAQEDELILGIDVSGSIDDELLKRFRACVLPAARRAKKTTIITFDERIREIHTSTKPELLLRQLRFKTGSHSSTSVVELFEEVARRKPSAVAILTDGYIALPERPYPKTHWVLTPSGAPLPWGMNYKMHTSW